MSIKQTLISFLLITTFHISFGQLFDPKEIPSRFWFNTSGKNGISVGYALLEMKHVSSTVGKLNLNIPKMGITISSQNTYEWLKKKDIFLDYYYNFTYFPVLQVTIDGESARFKSYSWDIMRGVDIIG